MIRQLLEEVKAAPLDEASRNRLKEIHRASIKELEAGLAPELVEELERLTLPFTEEGTPSEAELRIAQAQLVGWLEGLFHGIQTAIYAQQMAARAQFEQMRRALPAGRRARRSPGPRPAGPGRAAPVPASPAACTSERDDLGHDPGVRGGRSGGSRRTTTRPSRPTSTSAAPGAATRVTLAGRLPATVVNSARWGGGGGEGSRPLPSSRSTLRPARRGPGRCCRTTGSSGRRRRSG